MSGTEIPEIDYKALERNLRAFPASLGLGIPCSLCSIWIPYRFKFGKIIYHPLGRPCGTT